jgi:hypothetical protein
MGLDMVMIAQQGNAQTAIVLMQFPASMQVNPQLMEQQMGQAFKSQMQQSGQNMQVVGTEEVTLRGQQVTLTVSEGQSSSGGGFRQKAGVFQGKSGAAMIMILGPIDNWDQPAIEAVISSMR